ncbi:MAG: signal peptidase I [Rickettsiales bacterium]|nr:signal peptidase I [Rickettsiales bacterium]
MSEDKKLKFYETWTFIIIVCVILPILFRTFIYSPRHIPSSSMKPTLLIGDYIFISKFSYGYSKFDLPFGYAIDYFDGRIFDKEPKRGDIIVFRPSTQPDTDYIKRLVGLPGDIIQMKDGKLIINGETLPIKRVEDFYDEKEGGLVSQIKQYQETLPNGVTYYILDEIDGGPADNTDFFVVPEGKYFFMGDNRDNSADSRIAIGFVPKENLIGRAEVVFFSNEAPLIKLWEWIVSFRENRFWKRLG